MHVYIYIYTYIYTRLHPVRLNHTTISFIYIHIGNLTYNISYIISDISCTYIYIYVYCLIILYCIHIDVYIYMYMYYRYIEYLYPYTYLSQCVQTSPLNPAMFSPTTPTDSRSGYSPPAGSP